MENTSIAYKLFRELKDGSISPLFINKKSRLPIGEWMEAEDHPTKGFAHRPGWHCCTKPVAPHLKTELKTGEKRAWYKVEICGVRVEFRPESQGGKWYLAENLRIIEKV